MHSRATWAIGIMLGLTTTALPQDKAPSLAVRLSDPVFASWITQEKISKCLECHFQASLGVQLAGGLNSFSRRQELEQWLSADKHTIARRRVEPIDEADVESELRAIAQKLDDTAEKLSEQLNLNPDDVYLSEFPEQWIGASNLLSKRICDQLWGTDHVKTAEGYQDFRDQCLTCHGGYGPGESGFELADKLDGQIGIDCLHCHEADAPGWREAHYGSNWRLKHPEEKRAAGMENLVNVATQGSLCFDCHIGNRDKNMFVNHEMYAAGHPPLPSIELETFCKQMPQHWQTPAELHRNLQQDNTRDEYFEINYPGVGSPEQAYWDTRKMLIGVLAARLESLNLLRQSATADKWADYALYDCAACHHELRSTSLRQQRGYPGPPGRPRLPEWPRTLLLAAADFAGNAEQVRRLETELDAAVTAEPFGDAAAVSTVAERLYAAIERSLASAESKPLRRDQARRIARVIADQSAAELLTYDAARQVAWSLRAIAAEAARRNEPLPADAERLIASLDQPNGDADATGIDTELPSTREKFIYKENLRKDLQLRADYRPEVIAERLSAIVSALPADQGQ